MNLSVYAQQYRQDLLQRLVPFWTEFSLDTIHGGYICVISGKGEAITFDKWIKWHGQQAWAFGKLYQLTQQADFLRYTLQGADFLLHFGADTKDNWWEIVDCTGRGVLDASDAGAEAAAVAAWSLAHELTGEEAYADSAKKTLTKAVRRREKGLQKRTEAIFAGRQLKNIGELSALAKALTASQKLMGEKTFREKGEALLHELTKHFWEPRANIVLENVFPEGGYSDCLLGRRIHPGRVFEAFNAFYELTKVLNKRRIRQQLAQHILHLADTTWDDAYGGYFHWLDVKSLPASEPEAYYKYAWVQLEAATALLRAYQVLQDRTLLKHWQRVNDYLWQHFRDNSKEGEWVGVLSRHGEPLFTLKATPEKNAYYSVKNLLESADLLDVLIDK
ncbi:AGE family epimerase/isomerase [Runella salmonicolor]|uniref:AGE family epimerase/isomerase n=1 Tax=Runella salmonicolor TaxID=2950278 RepID=A0ABT1FHD3_9BACT|nr:AGE family epimerase/isomerase [Runella salmonicolor]MCP1381171.1 AGE family epimerase/isomerase [Runella salmonicolor]